MVFGSWIEVLHHEECELKAAYRPNALTYGLIRDRHDLWSFLNQATRLGVRFITFGLLIKLLDSTELAQWYVFVALFGVASLVEGGGKTVITRQVAARAAKPLRSVRRFLAAAMRFYCWLVLGVAVAALALGLWWLEAITGMGVGGSVAWLWMLFVAANALGLIAAVLGGAIGGLEGVAHAQRNEAIALLVNLGAFLGLWAFIPTAGLWIPVGALFASSLAGLGLNLRRLGGRLGGLRAVCLRRGYVWRIVRRYVGETSKVFTAILAFHLLTSVFLLLLAAYQPNETVAAYGVAMQLFNLVLSFVSIWTFASFPRWASAHSARAAWPELAGVLARSIPALLLGLITAAALGPSLLLMWKGSQVMLSGAALWLLAAILLHEHIFFTIVAQFLLARRFAGMVATLSIGFAAAFLVSAWGLFAGLQAGLTLVLLARLVLGMALYDPPIAWAAWRIGQRGAV